MEVHSGILTVKVSSVLKDKMYSNVWCILYNGRGNFSPRIDFYEDKTQVGLIPHKKTIYIEEAKWKWTESLEHEFSFEVKHNKQYVFVTASKSELRLWILSLCCVSKELFDTKQIIGVGDLNNMDTSYLTEDGEDLVVEENSLYSSCSDLFTFIVTAEQSEACLQHGLKGLFKLRIGQGVVQLLQLDSDKEVACWSLGSLKNYGHSTHTCFLQAGSRSLTGAGKFVFETTEGKRITQRITFEAQRYQSPIQKSENASVTGASAVTANTQNRTNKSKPPPPPSKPKSIIIRNSSNENKQPEHKDSHFTSEHQLSKRGIPAFGVPVLAPLTAQSSSLTASYSITPAEDESSYIDSLNVTADSLEKSEKKHLMLSRSVSSMSSESGDKKNDKKAQKELKKEQKKKAEEEKKERKRLEEERKKEQKRREEEEKRIKKEQKKNKQKAAKTSSTSSQSEPVSHSNISSEYSEAGDFSSYTEVNIVGITSQSHTLVDNTNSERIYSEPWGVLPLLPKPPSEGGDQVEYAQPEKRPNGKALTFEPRDTVHTENYEEFQAREFEESAPPLMPPTWEQEEGDSTHLYSHLNQGESTLPTQENVYGLASASASVTVSEEENPYEDTSSSNYERVG